MFGRWMRRIAMLFLRSRFDAGLEEEMRLHRELREHEKIADGMASKEAHYAVSRQFGNDLALRERSRDMWGWNWLETFFQDIRYGLRQLRRNPGFTIVAVLTLALGIGANTAIFSVVDGVLIHPLPFKDPGRLVVLWQRVPHFGINSFTTPDFQAWKHQTSLPIAATGGESFNIGEGDRTEHVQAWMVSANFFSLLGVKPIIGRAFLPQEDRPNGRKVVILGYGLWQRDFSGARGVLGKVLELNGQPYTVIGVLPQDFANGLGSAVELWVPFESDFAFAATRHSYSLHWLMVIGRLRKGVTLAQAQAEMNALGGSFGKEYPQTDARLGVDVSPLADLIVGSVRPALLMLFVAVGLVLLIACANVANLLLARATTRTKEMAVRIAVGAGRTRLVKQLLTESVLLAVLGGALSLVFAFWGLILLRHLNPGDIPRLEQIRINPGVLAFTVVVCGLTGVLFGAAPASQATKTDLNQTLKESNRGLDSGSGRRGLRHALVIFEVAVSLMLLISAGLMARSFRALEAAPLGFNPHGLLVMQFTSSQAELMPAATPVFYERVLAKVRSLPGVASAAIGRDLPLGGGNPSSPFSIAGQPVALQQRPVARARWISPDYFRTMGIPVLRGRTFTDEDDSRAPGVVVISQEMARQFWPHRNPIGEQIKPAMGARGWCTIVGIVGDVRKYGPEYPFYPTMYYSYLQVPAADIPLAEGSMRLIVRSSLPARPLTGLVRTAVATINADAPVYDVQTMDEIVSGSMSRARLDSALFGMFGLLAFLMAVAGIYAVISYSVTRRVHEIGIRMALGAQKSDALKMVVREGLKLTLVGAGIGLAGAFGLTRFLSSLLFGIKPTDPLTFVAVSLILIAVALLACYIPARRAAKVDPMVALRCE